MKQKFDFDEIFNTIAAPQVVKIIFGTADIMTIFS